MKNPFDTGQETSLPITNPMEGKTINTRDKAAMLQRVAGTHLRDAAHVQFEKWMPADGSGSITYEYAESPMGDIIVAATTKGICFTGFTNNNRAAALDDLIRRFPLSTIAMGISSFQSEAITQVNNPQMPLPVHLHVKGSAFQLSIWKKLVQIPWSGLTTYAQLGTNPKSSRAVGRAIATNPVAFILPCHRVIYTDGSFDSYFWGAGLKEKLLTMEAEPITL